ncbi:cupin domain-containing protein [Streptomyces sp. NPDC058291]|uniref:cupin domain-containing protein n=1 Tax=Streptomyces sp. NPDC058291 TaxID=3346427 RepID=UPI0036E3C8AB
MNGAGNQPDEGGRIDVGGPRVLCDAQSLTAGDDAPGGALWRLTEPGRQLDANLVRIPPHERIAPHVEPDLDVLVLVVSGDGALDVEPAPQPLRQGSLVWLPHGTGRSVAAGDKGLSYLTVHRRRPGMQIHARPTS